LLGAHTHTHNARAHVRAYAHRHSSQMRVCGIRGERYRREREGRETSRDRGKRGSDWERGEGVVCI